jgi:hypothetical protein
VRKTFALAAINPHQARLIRQINGCSAKKQDILHSRKQVRSSAMRTPKIRSIAHQHVSPARLKTPN